MTPAQAVTALCERVKPVEVETAAWPQAAGRVLAEEIVLDRPSPACDVSAMDGYAVRLADVERGTLPVHGEIQAGMWAPEMPVGAAVRIFTGAMVPSGADAIIPREQLTEQKTAIQLPEDLLVKHGQHIRRRGENGEPGRVLAEPGRTITAPMLAAIASCGKAAVRIHRRLRVGILTTGGEVCGVSDAPEPWRLRDANGPALLGLLSGVPWIDVMPPRHAPDRPEALAQSINSIVKECDALLLTGGVSAGDYDYVPAVLSGLGMTIIFHKLPIRPGKPILGAVDAAGRPVLGLPGNPVSAMVTARRFAAAALRRRAGLVDPEIPLAVEVADSAPAPAKLTWFPLVCPAEPGKASLIAGMGSGDWVAAAGSIGFIEVPPGEPASGPRRLYPWTITS